MRISVMGKAKKEKLITIAAVSNNVASDHIVTI